MIRINRKIISKTKKKAIISARKREVFIFSNPKDHIQRFLNVIHQTSRIMPHKHQHSPEVFLAVSGKSEISTYYNDGKQKDKIIIEPNSKIFGVEVKKGEYHSLKALDKWSAVYIIMKGPYKQKKHKLFPKWLKK